ncbi:hypothetical protein HDU77_011546 [Chytriomyces hyalinus]|nr:hypothetical protein HDU77_011546 [Chytriomyces hyalinus]
MKPMKRASSENEAIGASLKRAKSGGLAALREKHRLQREGHAPAPSNTSSLVTQQAPASVKPVLTPKPSINATSTAKARNPFGMGQSATLMRAPSDPFSVLSSIESCSGTSSWSDARPQSAVEDLASDLDSDSEEANMDEKMDSTSDALLVQFEEMCARAPVTHVQEPGKRIMSEKLRTVVEEPRSRLFSLLASKPKDEHSKKRLPMLFPEKLHTAPSRPAEPVADTSLNSKPNQAAEMKKSVGLESQVMPESPNMTDSMNTPSDPNEPDLMDHSLKTGFSIVSTELHPWLQERTEEDNFLSLHNHRLKIPLQSLTLKARFDQCLISHVYPNGPRAPTHIGLMTRILAIKPGVALKPFERNELNHFVAKESEWRQSFKSLWASLMSKNTDYFYYMNSEFTVLFQSPNADGNPTGDFRAVLAKASLALRNVLTAKKIHFKCIAALQKVKKTSTYTGLEEGNEDEKNEARQEIMEMERIQPGRTVTNSKADAIPCQLVFSGAETIIQLKEFLTDWTEHSVEKRALHQPVLISPSPFLNASLKMADIVKLERVERLESSTSNSSKSVATAMSAFTMKVSGILLPTSIAVMKDIMRSTCINSKKEQVKMMMEIESRTVPLNLEVGSRVTDSSSRQDEGDVDVNVCGKSVNVFEVGDGRYF